MNWYKKAKFNKNAKQGIPWTPDIETIKKIDYNVFGKKAPDFNRGMNCRIFNIS